MAIIELSPLLKSIRGRAGSSDVLYPQGDRTIGRSYVVPANPSSSLRDQIKALFATANEAFPLLTPEERADWESLAAELKRTDKNGNPYGQTACGIYAAVNTVRLGKFQPITDVAPPAEVYAAPSSIGNFRIDPEEETVTISVNSPQSDGFTFWRVTPNIPSVNRKPRINELHGLGSMFNRSLRIKTTAGNQEDVIPLSSLADPPEQGDRIGVMATAYSPGFLKGESLFATVNVTDL